MKTSEYISTIKQSALLLIYITLQIESKETFLHKFQ